MHNYCAYFHQGVSHGSTNPSAGSNVGFGTYSNQNNMVNPATQAVQKTSSNGDETILMNLDPHNDDEDDDEGENLYFYDQ